MLLLSLVGLFAIFLVIIIHYCHMNTMASASRLYSMAVRSSSLRSLLVSFIQKVFLQFGILCGAEPSQSVLKTVYTVKTLTHILLLCSKC